MSACLNDVWFFGAFTWFDGTSLLVSFEGGGTAAFAAAWAALAVATVRLRAGADRLLASVAATRWFIWILSFTLA